MSKLAELIKELCPDGVEFVELGQVCDFKNGFAFKSSKFKLNGLPVLRITNIDNGIIDISNCVYFSTKDYKEDLSSYVVQKDDIVVAMSGATTGKIGINTTNEILYLNQRVGKFIPQEKVLNRFYLYHWLMSQSGNIMKAALGSGAQPNLSTATMKKFRIPLPPLPVQCEIVRILDNFTALTSALTAELTAQRKRYSGLLNSLLSYEGRSTQDGVLWKKLGDIATEIYRGAGIKRDEVTEEGIQCVRYGEIYTSYNIWFDTCISHTDEAKITSKKYFEKGDILFAITGESVEEIAKSCAYVGDEKCLAGGDIVVMKHEQNPKYLAYALATTNAQMQKSKGKVKSKVVHSSIPAIKEIIVPIPSLEEQQRIVDILDRFDKLCNDLSEGLPAEIAARQKQYEYYRDKLLTFKEKKA